MTESLVPHFNRARAVLNERKSKKFGDWIDKVRVVPESQNLIAPPVSPAAADAVYAALLEGKQLSADYRKRGQEEAKHYEVLHPLGLVFRQRAIYLVASVKGYDTPIQFALHRFLSTRVEQKPVRIPKGFDLDHYIQSGHFGYLLGDSFELELLFTAERGAHLKETPLSPQQIFEEVEDGRIRVKSVVKDTHQLRWWLLGFGDEVEVVAPESYRKRFAQLLERMVERYR